MPMIVFETLTFKNIFYDEIRFLFLKLLKRVYTSKDIGLNNCIFLNQISVKQKYSYKKPILNSIICESPQPSWKSINFREYPICIINLSLTSITQQSRDSPYFFSQAIFLKIPVFSNYTLSEIMYQKISITILLTKIQNNTYEMLILASTAICPSITNDFFKKLMKFMLPVPKYFKQRNLKFNRYIYNYKTNVVQSQPSHLFYKQFLTYHQDQLFYHQCLQNTKNASFETLDIHQIYSGIQQILHWVSLLINKNKAKMRNDNSRLRKYLWETVQTKFSKRDLYDKKILGEQDLHKLLAEMLDDTSDFSVGNVLRTVFKVDASIGKKQLSLHDFAQNFIQYSGELGLKTFNALRRDSQNTLSSDQFYNLFMSSFRSLNCMRIRESFMKSIFNVIDSNRDGSISITQYQHWIRDFVSNPHPLQAQRKRYYLKEDDSNIQISGDEPIIPEAKEIKTFKQQSSGNMQIRVPTKQAQQKVQRNLPKFSKVDLSDKIVKHTIVILSKYDMNRNNNFQIQEIQAALKDILKGEDDEIFYGLVNDFRYNMEKVEIISYEALAKFFLACHCGQMTIKRMHMKQMFSKCESRIMNKEQFSLAFGNSLKMIQFNISEKDLSEIFQEIDRDRDGWVTYAQFFQFLRIFFRKKQTRISVNIGTSTIMDFASQGAIGQTIGNRRRAKVNHRVRRDVNNQWKNLLDIKQGDSKNIGELIRNQIKAIIVRLDRDRSFEKDKDALTRLLFQIFQKTSGQIQYSMRNVLKYKKNLGDCMTYDEIIKFLIEIQFGELTLQAFKSKKNIFGSTFKISFQDFVQMMKQNCYYIGLDPSREQFEDLFKIIDKDQDGFITANEFLRCIKIYLAGHVDVDDLLVRVFDYALVKHEQKQQKKAKMKKQLAKMIPLRRGQSKQVKEVVTQLYTDLKAIFDRYDVNNDEQLDDKELEALLRGVLKENTQQQLDYIFWNMFRIDKKGKGSIQFQDFAPFILKHSAQITLQRFHAQQKSGKSHINLQQFKLMMNNAYHFISAIKKDNLHLIFGELDKDKDDLVSYKQFLGWILTDIAPKIR